MGAVAMRKRRFVQRSGVRVQQRSITVSLDIDNRVADRVETEGVTYSSVVEEALRLLFDRAEHERAAS